MARKKLFWEYVAVFISGTNRSGSSNTTRPDRTTRSYGNSQLSRLTLQICEVKMKQQKIRRKSQFSASPWKWKATGFIVIRIREVRFRQIDNPIEVASNFCHIYGLKEDKVMTVASQISAYLTANVPGYTLRMSDRDFPYSFEND